MTTYLFNHMKKYDGQKRVFESAPHDYRDEDYTDYDLFPAELLKFMDQEDYKDLKKLDNNNPFSHRKNIQKI